MRDHESLEFEQVLARIDEAARMIVPFDSIGVWRTEAPVENLGDLTPPLTRR